MSESPAWLNKLNQYFIDAFLLHEGDLEAKRQINKFIRWWLEQVRNLLVVSAFYFLAQKSDSGLLKTLATVTSFLFFTYFVGWSNTFSFRFFPYIKNQSVNFWFNMVVWLAVLMPVYLLVVIAVVRVFDALSKIPPK